jgi:hypothetical protein
MCFERVICEVLSWVGSRSGEVVILNECFRGVFARSERARACGLTWDDVLIITNLTVQGPENCTWSFCSSRKSKDSTNLAVITFRWDFLRCEILWCSERPKSKSKEQELLVNHFGEGDIFFKASISDG